jgi:hypothetical protein
LIPVDSHQRMRPLIQGSFERDDDELESIRAMLTDISGHFGDVGIVQRCVHFVQDEEGRWLETKHDGDQLQSRREITGKNWPMNGK